MKTTTIFLTFLAITLGLTTSTNAQSKAYKEALLTSLNNEYSSRGLTSDAMNKKWRKGLELCQQEMMSTDDINEQVMALCALSKTRKDSRLHVRPMIHMAGTMTTHPPRVKDNHPSEYEGFNKFLEREGFHAFLHEDPSNKTLLLQWRNLNNNTSKDLQDYLKFLGGNKFLSHNLIIDMRYCKGENPSPDFIKLLFAKKANLGTIEVAKSAHKYLANQGQEKILDALIGNTADAESFSSNLKRADSFKGEIVFLMGPHASVAAEHILSIVKDNKLAETIGDATAGNGYLHIEEKEVEVQSGGYIMFPWPSAQIIRPNGKSLEGNPVNPSVSIPNSDDTTRLVTEALRKLN